MKRALWGVGLILVFYINTSTANAHPGNTAADGCHYCRTNCASWGEVEGARHCHNGGSAPAPTTIPFYVYPTSTPVAPTSIPLPTSTPVPTATPTQIPSPTPTTVPTSTPIPTSNPLSPTPIVQNVENEDPSSDGSVTEAFVGLGSVGGIGYAGWRGVRWGLKFVKL